MVVEHVLEGSKAEEAGLRGLKLVQTPYPGWLLGDVILEVDGKPITSTPQLEAELDRRKVGDKVRLLVARDGSKVPVTVTLQARDQKAFGQTRFP